MTEDLLTLLTTRVDELERALIALKSERDALMGGFTELSISLATLAADVATLRVQAKPTPTPRTS